MRSWGWVSEIFISEPALESSADNLSVCFWLAASLRCAFVVLWIIGCGLAFVYGGRVSPRRASNFSLAREKSPKARLNSGARGRTHCEPVGLSVRATAASQSFHQRTLRHFALLVPVDLATARDASLCLLVRFGWAWGLWPWGLVGVDLEGRLFHVAFHQHGPRFQ